MSANEHIEAIRQSMEAIRVAFVLGRHKADPMSVTTEDLIKLSRHFVELGRSRDKQ